MLRQETGQWVTSATARFGAEPDKTFPTGVELPEQFVWVRMVPFSKKEIIVTVFWCRPLTFFSCCLLETLLERNQGEGN